MSDPIPAASTTADPEQEQQLPTNPEDRKAAAALSSLNNGDGADSGSKMPSTIDQEALGQAMSRLEIAAGQSGNNASSAAKEKKATPQQAAAAEVKKKAAVKVAAEDVNLLVCCIFFDGLLVL